jgi:hypothetical protein
MVYFGNMVKEFYVVVKLKELQEFVHCEMLTKETGELYWKFVGYKSCDRY